MDFRTTMVAVSALAWLKPKVSTNQATMGEACPASEEAGPRSEAKVPARNSQTIPCGHLFRISSPKQTVTPRKEIPSKGAGRPPEMGPASSDIMQVPEKAKIETTGRTLFGTSVDFSLQMEAVATARNKRAGDDALGTKKWRPTISTTRKKKMTFGMKAWTPNGASVPS